MNRVLRFGMVGGGEGALIGDIHARGATFDRKSALVAGCFSRDAAKSEITARKWGIDSDRVYATYREMAEKEAAREDRIDYVSIVTPNNSHYDIAKTFLEHGFHVVCDKPLTVELAEAEELKRIAEQNGLLFCVTYTYSGYPMVKQAREMVQRGEIGDIITVMAEYPQEWVLHASKLSWRMDPSQGKSCCVADIGVHIAHTVSYITGLRIDSLCADMLSHGPLMELDNNANMMVKYTSGATGMYWCSQVAAGSRNGLKIRLFGTKGSLEWQHDRYEELQLALSGKPLQLLARGRDPMFPAAAAFNRLPGGHPEGLYEAFANIYAAFGAELSGILDGSGSGAAADYPRIDDGIDGVRFIDKCLESSQGGVKWVPYS
ncbi:Gfo/Idh/MocA family protein [Paenibacillus ginsengarvi]|uniref:Gfo/Idh/MocA family oxidoreductase n=1 Tax=Paenibacillus ginsengarvi TaxID=400777 RepID=A0A3B0BCF0_9BACL|nr:Gfo/Idh/MocA family oxidoreductase [Paenibacillus ginsengarvi]RKN70109.1 gfo/Idh/MocA family oxidoreductase [Paenibacillus ginsengarvi]